MKTLLADLEFVPAEVTYSWRFNELLGRRVQVTVEQLVHVMRVARRMCCCIEENWNLVNIQTFHSRPLVPQVQDTSNGLLPSLQPIIRK